MSRLARWLSTTFAPATRTVAPVATPRFRPTLQSLDDRIVPSFLTNIVSTNGGGGQPTGTHVLTALSADARYVAFISNAAFVPEDVNGLNDVYRKDRVSGEVILVSRGDGQNGAVGNGSVNDSGGVSISADGRFVAFSSRASNLTGTDNNNRDDIFVRDIVNGTTQLVSVTADGVIGDGNSDRPRISADGKFVSFLSNATNLESGSPSGTNLYHYNLLTRTYARIGTQASDHAINADGRFVAFASTDPNLVSGDTNGVVDVFVFDTSTFTNTRVSVATGGSQVNNNSGGSLDISDDGRFVAFSSVATDVVSGDTNGQSDVFLHDRKTSETTRMSTTTSGGGNGSSVSVSISGNGRFVAFRSTSNDLVTNDTNGFADVFVTDRVTGAVSRVSLSTAGEQANADNFGTAISRDGQFVAYTSQASNLATDTNSEFDVFVTQRPLPALFAAAVSADPSANPLVIVFNPPGSPNEQVANFNAYPTDYKGGVFVAMGDLNNDGIEEAVTSTGPGGTANIRVFNITGAFDNPPLLASFFAYPPAFLGGVNAAIGDVNNDGYGDIVCGVGKGGGPNVRILDGKKLLELAAKNDGSLEAKLLDSVANGGTLIASFFAYTEEFTGGVRVAVADVDGDGFADVITGVGSGGAANIRVFNARTTLLVNTLPAFPNPNQSVFGLPPSFTGGTFVSAGDVNNDGIPDLIIGVESGGGPNARAYSLNNLDPNNPLRSFFAFDPNQTGGVKVASVDLDADGFDDIIAGTGPGTLATVRAFSGRTGDQLINRSPFGRNLFSGINVG